MKKLSDAKRAELRKKLVEYHSQRAIKIARDSDWRWEAQSVILVFAILVCSITAIISKGQMTWHLCIMFVLVVVSTLVMVIAVLTNRNVLTRMKHIEDETLELFIVGLRERHAEARANAARALGELGGEVAIEALRKAMEKEQDDAAKRAMEEAIKKLLQ